MHTILPQLLLISCCRFVLFFVTSVQYNRGSAEEQMNSGGFNAHLAKRSYSIYAGMCPFKRD